MSEADDVLLTFKVAVYGAGGVGGYFGARLAAAGCPVSFVARGAHLDAMRRDGLTVQSPFGDVHVDCHATDDPGEIGPSHYVLVCVKTTDTDRVADDLRPLLREDTTVISLQNGVDSETRFAAAVGADRIMGGAAFILSSVARPGLVQHTGGPARVIIGELDGSLTPRGHRLREMLERARVDCVLSDDIKTVLWNKFAFICAQAGMTAAARLPIDRILGVPEGLEMYRGLCAEVCEVAAAEGVPLAGDTVDRHVEFAKGLAPGSHSSLHYDLTHGKPMELETLHGTVVRSAARHRIPVPMTHAVYALLKPWNQA